MVNIINDKSLVLGVMSGTSMDGLDISCARYYKQNNVWKFDLLEAETFEYQSKIKLDFLKVFNKKYDLHKMDIKFSHLISDYIELFLKDKIPSERLPKKKEKEEK